MCTWGYRKTGKFCGILNRVDCAVSSKTQNKKTQLEVRLRMHIKFAPWTLVMCEFAPRCLFWTIFERKHPKIKAYSCLKQEIQSYLVKSWHPRMLKSATQESTSEIVPRQKWAKVTQHSYSDEIRASIGKYASLHEPTATVRHFSGICGHAVPESTVRIWFKFWLYLL